MADTNGVGVEGNGNVHAPSVAVEMTTASAGARDTKEPRQRAYSGLAEAKHDAMSGDKDGDKEETDGEKKKEEPKPMVALGTLLRYMTCLDYSLYAIGVVAAGVNGLAMPAFSFVFGEILDNFNPGSGEDIADSVATASMWMALAGAIAWVASYIEISCFNTVAERQARAIRSRYFSSLMNQDVGWYDSQQTEALVTKVADETRSIRDGLGDKLGLGFRQFIGFVGGFVLAFIHGWQLTLILLVSAPLLAGSAFLLMTVMADVESKSAKMYAKAGAIAQENLAAVRTVQAFGAQRKALQDYRAELEGTCKAGIKKGFVEGAGMGLINFLMFTMYGVAFYIGAIFISGDREDVLATLAASGCDVAGDFSTICTPEWETAQGPLCAGLCRSAVEPCLSGDICETGGNIVLVFFAVIIGAMALGQTTPSVTAVTKARVAGYEVFNVIDRAVPIDVSASGGTAVNKNDVRGRVVLRDVHFTYPSRPDRKVLDGVNLTIEPGSTVALVGRSGCGKSTIVSLLQRFYDPTSGSIELDDLGNLSTLNVKSLRDVMGLVSQEPVLFRDTVRANIKLGATANVTDRDVEAAARVANAHHFIMEFRDKYDTDVGQRGAALSGGQKQRVAIARALIRKPKILLLDEATSALDSQSEQVVQEALNHIMASRSHTTVVIAHRLSTIRNADKIVVLDQGRVAEQGTHEELMEIEGGIYRDLVEAQSTGRDGTLTELQDADDTNAKGPVARARSHSSAHGRSASSAGAAMGKAEEGGDDEEEEEDEIDPDVDTSVWRIFRMTSENWPWLVLGFCSAIIYGTLYPLFAIIFSEVMTVFYEPKIEVMRDDSLMWCIGFVIVAVVGGISGITVFGSFGVTGNRLARKLRAMALDSMLHKDMAFHDRKKNTTGALATQLATDATLVDAMASKRGALIAQNIVTVGAGLTIAVIADWRLTLVMLGCLPIIAVSGYFQSKMWMGQDATSRASLEKAGHVVEESVFGIRTVAAFNLGNEMSERYSAQLSTPQREGMKSGHLAGFSFGFSQFVMFGAYGLCFYVGGIWVDDGSLEFGDMLTVLMAIMMAGWGIGESNSTMPDAAKATKAIRNIFTLLDKKPTIDCTAGSPATAPATITGHIQLKDVVFEYPTREGRVLDHVSLDVAPGTSVALVGSSGSGKSTIVQLVQRFYDPQEGTVLLDGRNLSEINVPWLRRQIGVVSQEPTLFNGTVADNIKYGLLAHSEAPDLGRDISVPLLNEDSVRDGKGAGGPAPRGTHRVPEAIVRAAKSANAHDFIVRMQDGYHTVIKPDSLSGGQKQRVAIARAVLRDPRILLLDEATSALDNRSEQVVQAALDALMADTTRQRTTIVVAHRLSTIYRSDQIVVMHEGKIVEQGTHEFLISDQAPHGKYRTMWQQQSLATGNGNGSGSGSGSANQDE